MTGSRNPDPEVQVLAEQIRALDIAEDKEFADVLVWKLAKLCKYYLFLRDSWYPKFLAERREVREAAEHLSKGLEAVLPALRRARDNNYLANLILHHHPDYPGPVDMVLNDHGQLTTAACERSAAVSEFMIGLGRLETELSKLKAAADAVQPLAGSAERLFAEVLPEFAHKRGNKPDLAIRDFAAGVVDVLREYPPIWASQGPPEAPFPEKEVAEIVNELLRVVGESRSDRTMEADVIRPLLSK